MSLSFQSFALAEPLAPTFRFYWAIVNLSPRPVFFEHHQMNSRWRTHLVLFSSSSSCTQSRDQSAAVYQLGRPEIPSLESIIVVNSSKVVGGWFSREVIIFLLLLGFCKSVTLSHRVLSWLVLPLIGTWLCSSDDYQVTYSFLKFSSTAYHEENLKTPAKRWWKIELFRSSVRQPAARASNRWAG